MSVEDAKIIEACGADRIELVSALTEGGLTPSFGLIESVVKSVNIPVNVMVRHHNKSFSYSCDDIKIMKKDIEIIKDLGANGVVLGLLNSDKMIDEKNLEELLKLCNGVDVTFHRAIDETDPVASVGVLNKYKKITNILTSGGIGKVTDNLTTIKSMINRSEGINILLGSGLSLDNIFEVKEVTNATDFHIGTDIRIEKNPFAEIDKERLKKIVNIVKK